jgi:bis(5'-nucleosyl)-tetraphosphatase (symmetrical)
MATWAVGDLQGCYPELQRLIERLRFDPARDRLWFCGDLVNRGGQSLEVLRLLRELGDRAVVTLGNHDLSLLAVAQRDEAAQVRVNPELRSVLFAPDRDALLDWLRTRRLLHHDAVLNYTMVHAGFAQRWNLKQAQRVASEIERELRGPQYARLLQHLFGNRPALWHPGLKGTERLRAGINVLTRMRYCDAHGRLDFDAKGSPGTQPVGLYPWFEVPGMRRRETRIVFGHWSALGRFAGLGVYGLDTGCVWGGRLTAMRLDSSEPEFVSVAAEPTRKRDPRGEE